MLSTPLNSEPLRSPVSILGFSNHRPSSLKVRSTCTISIASVVSTALALAPLLTPPPALLVEFLLECSFAEECGGGREDEYDEDSEL